MRAVYSRVLLFVADDESIVQILARRSKEEAKERKVPVLFHDTLRDCTHTHIHTNRRTRSV
eukprot:12856980-Ditylum_brightwellii.AAC.1